MRLIYTLLITMFTSSVFACGGGWYEPHYYTFFQNDIDSSGIHPYVFQPNYDYFGNGEEDIEPNLQAWADHFEGKYKTTEIRKVLYDFDLKECVQLNAYRNGVHVPKMEMYTKSSFERAIIKQKEDGFLDYLMYAKKCAIQAQIIEENYYSWYYNNTGEKRDSAQMMQLLEEGKTHYNATNDKELKTRYAFQLIRLAHYRKEYELGAKLYEKYAAPLKSEKYSFYRAWEQYAGVLHSLDRKDEAGYIFSRVFDKCPDRRASCINSFDFGRSAFDAVSSLCQNPEEESVLYAMRALTVGGSPEGEMENIIAMNACSPYVELFYTRSIYNWEKEFLTPKEYWSKKGKETVFERDHNVNVLDQLRQVAIEMQGKCSKERKEFWQFNEAYVYFMQEDYKVAKEKLDSIKGSKFIKPIRDISFVCELMQIETLTIEIEQELSAKANSFNDDVLDIYYNFLKVKFFESGQLAKAYLIDNDIEHLRQNLNINLIELIEAFKLKAPQSAFEKGIQKRISFPDLADAKGTYYLQRNQLKEAVKAFKEGDVMGEYSTESSNESLFMASSHAYFNQDFSSQARPIEGVDGERDYEEFYITSNNKKELANSLLYLEKEAKSLKRKSPEKAAKIYFNIATAWNNMSPYGWFRSIQYYGYGNCCNDYIYNVYAEHSKSEKEKTVWDFRLYMNQGGKVYDHSIAVSYLEKALALSQDDELKAKVYFKLAEANLFYGYASDSESSEEAVKATKAWYGELKKLQDTQYYKEVIHECGYFANYCRFN